MRTRELRIPVPERGEVSAALLDPGDAVAALVFAHGAGADMRHAFLETAARALAEEGIATLRYQFPYTEAGRRRPDARGTLLATVRAAVETAREALPGLPLLAGGKSMGGRMTSQAAAEEPLPGVRGIVFFGFPLHAPGRSGTERADHLSEVALPLLFLQGTRDKLAGLEGIEAVCKGLGARATLHVVEEADHSFHVPKRSGRRDEEVIAELARAVREWADALRAEDPGGRAG